MKRQGRKGRGFRRAVDLVGGDIRRAGETRGFSETRLLTHWAEIAGPEGEACRPVKVSFPRGSLGAVLTVLCAGAQAPMLAMRLPKLRERVNAAYGYNAVARIDITQTAPDGFGRPEASAPRGAGPRPAPPPEALARARESTREVADEGLRAALERLGGNIISRRRGENPRPDGD